MQKQIALFRGINVSGKNKIAMKDLKAEFGKLGYENAATLLNSGNIVFESAESLFIFFICNKLLYAQKLFF